MDEQMNILIEPLICSQIVDNNYDFFTDVRWEDQQLLGFLSIYLPEIEQTQGKDEKL